MEFINNNAHTDLYIYLSSIGSGATTPPLARVASVESLDGMSPTNIAYITNGGPVYNVTFSREVTEPVRLSVPPVTGDPDFQALRDANYIMPGRYNPVTNRIDSRVNRTGTYTVVENRVNFEDIGHLSAEAQRAILVMASQGIISGTRPGQFSPENPINRAQFATITVRKLGLHNPNADGGFTDVPHGAWYRAAIGAASYHRIMTGTGVNPPRFSPNQNMPREQIVAVAARILRTQMGYRNPTNPDDVLQRNFNDAHTIPQWARTDISLAAREDLVVRRADRNFRPTDQVNRSEAALILYNLYRKLW
jgi:hypothetical protein